MAYQFPPRNSPDSDPAPNVPTLEEIELAEELRRRLELRLLSGTDVPTPGFGAVEYDWGVRYVDLASKKPLPADHVPPPSFGSAFDSRGSLKSTAKS